MTALPKLRPNPSGSESRGARPSAEPRLGAAQAAGLAGELPDRVPEGSELESVPCYACGRDDPAPFLEALDDLGGAPGVFPFVRCRGCELIYQSPRVRGDLIERYYDETYLAHGNTRGPISWGPLKPLVARAFGRHDRRKLELVRRATSLNSGDRVVDLGSGSGSFLSTLVRELGVQATGVDFKDLGHLPDYEGVEFHHGSASQASLQDNSYSLATLWHVLEHDYAPAETLARVRRALRPEGRCLIEVPRLDSRSFELYRERWPGLQAPQHTILFSKATLLAFVEEAGFEVVEYLPYGAFPAWFYLFAGAAFQWRVGQGLDFGRAALPYFLGRALLSPLLLFERRLNLAMQTVICRPAS